MRTTIAANAAALAGTAALAHSGATASSWNA